MKTSTRFSSLSLLAFFLLVSFPLSAQLIFTFPYVEDFDGFPQGNQGASLEPNPQAFPIDWSNVNGVDFAPDDDGRQDWYAVRGATPSGGTGPVADHTSARGLYLYVEDSGGGANHEQVSLLTPVFLIGSLSRPTLSVYVHSDVDEAGRGLGGDSSYNDLKIDIFSRGSWTMLDSIGALNSGWTEFVYDLSGYGRLVRFRFRVNNNNYGDFVHDIAIDDFRVFDFPNVDGAITEAKVVLDRPQGGYTLAPVGQGPDYRVRGSIQNRGSSLLTDLKVVATYAGGGYQDSLRFDSLAPLQFEQLLFNRSLSPTSAGLLRFTLSASQQDTFPANNIAVVPVVDSVFARDDSIASGGLGLNGLRGQFGNMFTLTQSDRLTSSSFFLNGFTLGDSTRVRLYHFGTQVPGEPDTLGGLIDSTDYLQIRQQGWHTLPFRCQPALAPGQYFIALEQVNTNNLGVGYDLDNFSPGVTFFGDGRSRWRDHATLPTSLQGYILIRMNFGPETAIALTASAFGASHGNSDGFATIDASGGTPPFMYMWNDGQTADTAINLAAGMYTVIVTDANGCVDSATVNVNEYGVGINDLLDAAKVQVYPNPNQGRFVVRGLDALGAGEEILLSLHDLSGREVMRKVSIAQDEIEVSLSRDFMGGIYLLHVQSQDLRVVKRVVINP
jgi:hypothetical protein